MTKHISCADLSNDPKSAMEATYDRLADEALTQLELLQKQPPRQPCRLWIALAGAPGSGKTTLAEAVVERLQTRGCRATVVPFDGFHYPQAYLREHEIDIKDKGKPFTFNSGGMYEKLRHAQQADEACLPGYSREISDPVDDQILVGDHEIVICEGLYVLLGALAKELDNDTSNLCRTAQALEWSDWLPGEIRRWQPLYSLWDTTWYVAPPGGFEENKRRLVQRSLRTWNDDKTRLWGGGTAQEAATRRVEVNDAKNGRLIECCRSYADVVIDSVSF